MSLNNTEKGKLKRIYDYDSFPPNQFYRLELPNGQRGYDFVSKINFNTSSKPGDLDFTKQELVRRGYQWVFDCGFAIPVDKNGKDC